MTSRKEDNYGNIVKFNPNPTDINTELCVLCCDIISDFGHSPYPLSTHGKCCFSCNTQVVKARLNNHWGVGR